MNCLLDKGSDTTYVIEDVINELVLTRKKEPITVNIANANHLLYVGHIRDWP